MKNLIFLVIAIFVLSACSQRYSLQKRRYQKGFHWASAGHINHSKTSPLQTTVVYDHAKTPAVTINTPLAAANAKACVSTEVTANADCSQVCPLVPHYQKFKETVLAGKNTATMFVHKKKAVVLRKHAHRGISQREGSDFLTTLYIGYVVLGLIFLFIRGVMTLGLLDTLLITLGFIVGVMILYSIGKVFRSMMGM